MIENLLSSLQRVRKTGKGRWVACCPSHPDKSPSLSIRELDDGRILCHCFGGCSIDQIVGAVGLELSDLMGERDTEYRPRSRSRFNARDVLECIAKDATTVAMFGSALQERPLSETERLKLFDCIGRIQSSLAMVR